MCAAPLKQVDSYRRSLTGIRHLTPPEPPMQVTTTTTDVVTVPSQQGATPAVAAGQAVEVAPSAEYLYRAAKASRDELKNQLDRIVSERHSLLREIEDHPVGGPAVAGMQQRIVQLDARIAELDIAVAKADAAVATAAAQPGAVVDPPRPYRDGPPEEMFIAIPTLATLAMLPIIIAYARRIWKRGGAQAPSAHLPPDLSDRLNRLEALGEATALEVERIGEGQRFVTRLLTDRGTEAIGAGERASIQHR